MNTVFALFTIIILFLLVWFLVKVPRWQTREIKKNLKKIKDLTPKEKLILEKDLGLAENSFRVTLAQIIGGLVILGTLFATYQSVQVAQKNTEIAQQNLVLSEQGKLTDRFSKAVEMLGSEKVEIRIGGIYALERISKDSFKDHWTVMEVLTGFVRTNTKNIRVTSENSESNGVDSKTVHKDIEIAMSVIGRRKWIDREEESQRLDLAEVNLGNYDLVGVNLTRANLQGANLEKARLYDANLTNVNLNGANLKFAQLGGANLAKTSFINTNLDSTVFSDIFGVAKLRDAQNISSTQLQKSLNANRAFFSDTLSKYLETNP